MEYFATEFIKDIVWIKMNEHWNAYEYVCI